MQGRGRGLPLSASWLDAAPAAPAAPSGPLRSPSPSVARETLCVVAPSGGWAGADARCELAHDGPARMGAAPAAPMLGILVSCAIEVIFTFTWSVYIALRCLSKRLLFEVPWFARVSELAARMRSDEATTLSTELGILRHDTSRAEPWRRAVEAASSLASSPRRAHVEAVASS